MQNLFIPLQAFCHAKAGFSLGDRCRLTRQMSSGKGREKVCRNKVGLILTAFLCKRIHTAKRYFLLGVYVRSSLRHATFFRAVGRHV